jgi:hypothetical protein
MITTPWTINASQATFECDGWTVTILNFPHPKLAHVNVLGAVAASITPEQGVNGQIALLKDLSPTPMPPAVEQAIREGHALVRNQDKDINEVIANLQVIIDADNTGQDIPRHIDVAAVLESAIATINRLRGGRQA